MTLLASMPQQSPPYRCSSSLTVDVLGLLPADQLLILILSERRLQGSRNEEDRKLHTGPHSTSLNHFSITVESIKEREERLVKKSRSVWDTQVSVLALVRCDKIYRCCL